MQSRGFTGIEIVLIIATVAVVGFVGFAVYRAQQNMVAQNAAETQPVTESRQATDEPRYPLPEAPAIEDIDDLDAALKTLEATDLEAGLHGSSELKTRSQEL